MKKAVAFFNIILLIWVLLSCSANTDELDFISNGDGSCYISEIGIIDGIFEIPSSSPNGEKVTGIGYMSFRGCKGLSGVVIPDSIKVIEDYAFASCNSITKINIPDSVEYIGSNAFSCCENLMDIKIGSGLNKIYINAFEGCRNLNSISVSRTNKDFSSIEGVLYNKESTELIYYPIGKKANKFIIPDGVTAIKEEAFAGCRSLTSVIIPDSVTVIEKGAFDFCRSLKSVIFMNPNGWYISENESATIGTDVSSEFLSDSSKAAKYIESDYSSFYWYRK